jgi:hypothetical protein
LKNQKCQIIKQSYSRRAMTAHLKMNQTITRQNIYFCWRRWQNEKNQ